MSKADKFRSALKHGTVTPEHEEAIRNAHQTIVSTRTQNEETNETTNEENNDSTKEEKMETTYEETKKPSNDDFLVSSNEQTKKRTNEEKTIENETIIRSRCSYDIRKDFHKSLKHLATNQDRKIYELLEEAISDLFEKYDVKN